jgi:hypothetical protein
VTTPDLNKAPPARRLLGLLDHPVGLRLFLALYHVWLLVLVFVGQRLVLGPADAGTPVSVVFLLLLVGSEVLCTTWFEARRWGPARPGEPTPRRSLVLTFMALRVALLVGAWCLAVEIPARVNVLEDIGPFKRPFLFMLWWRAMMELSFTPLLTLFAFALWWIPVEVLVVRRRWARGFVMMLLPPLLLVAMIALRYGFTEEVDAAQLEAQEGVSILFRAGEVSDPEQRQVWLHPRKIYAEESPHAVFLSFGQTIGVEGDHRSNLWRIDLETGAYDILTAPQNRALAVHPGREHLFFRPFHDGRLHVVEKESFELVSRTRFPQGFVPLAYPHPVGLLDVPPALYVSQNMYPAIFTYDQPTARFTGAVDLVDLGLARPGDYCCMLGHRRQTDDLYVLIASYHAPILARFTRTAEPVLEAATELPELCNDLTIREGKDAALYLVSELDGDLFRVDADTLETEFFYPGGHGASIEFDEYLDQLLILSPGDGTLVFADLDGAPERVVDVGPGGADLAVTEAGVYIVSEFGVVFVSH